MSNAMAVLFMKMACPLMTQQTAARIVVKERMAAMIVYGAQRYRTRYLRRGRYAGPASALSVKQPALIIRPRRIDLRRILGLVAAVIVILLLLIDLRVIDAPAAARRGITRFARAAIGRIDITIVGLNLRRDLAWRQLLRCQVDGIAGRIILLRSILLGRVAARDGNRAAPRIARQRDLRGAGEGYGRIEHAFPLHQRIQGGGVGARQPDAAMGNRDAELAFGIGAVNGMADLGEKKRMGHRCVVKFLGVVVFLHSEGAERTVRRLMRRIAGRDRPLIARDAVHRDGHHLRVLVNGDGDFGLRGAGGEQHKASDSNDKGAHLTFGLRALTAETLTVPGIYMPEVRLWFHRALGPSSMRRRAPTRQGRGFIGRVALFVLASPHRAVANSSLLRNLLAAPALHMPARRRNCSRSRGIQMKTTTKIKTSALPTSSPVRLYLASAALALGLLAIPHIGHAQGIVRGAQEGAYEGNRAAGPVGGLVGGAVGAGVGGAVGAVDGVLGIPYRGHYRCRGFYDHHRRFHCYR